MPLTHSNSSFLPQDRVSEFAQMTPQQLLKETQRTAGNANLTMWHGTLVEKGKELKAAHMVSCAAALWTSSSADQLIRFSKTSASVYLNSRKSRNPSRRMSSAIASVAISSVRCVT